MRTAALAALAALLSACGFTLDFGRKVLPEEQILRDEIRDYYGEASAAFAGGNPDMLAALYDPAITKPMTKEQIRAWGEDFFKKHGPAGFKVLKLDFERLGHESAVVILTYKVETRDGKGDFGGTERDEFVKRGRKWSMTAWAEVR